jgi:periplasmic nitrate reductase NapD
MSALLHIASFVVQHRVDACRALDAALAASGRSEVAAREGARSVILCEGDSEREVVQRMEALRDIDGVFAVSLIYHHAEPRETLLEELVDADPS